MPAYQCAICNRDVPYEGKLPALYPFCSARCKWVDFGKWLHEQYAIDRELTPEELVDSAQTNRNGAEDAQNET
jgi:endogenous inhibitor of DNA gyrase (YacG/DUF329 family)